MDYNKAIEMLKKQHYRITWIRKQFLKIIDDLGHVTFKELIKHLKLKAENINMMSVYNTMHLLIKEGIIAPQSFNYKIVHYGFVQKYNVHLKCSKCKYLIHPPKDYERKNLFCDNTHVKELLSNMKWSTDNVTSTLELNATCKYCLRNQK